MPLTTPPTLTVPLYARNSITGETFLVRAQMPGPTGPTGPQGVNTIIISGFGPDVGGTGTPSNLPADGLLAAGFAATNSPQYQMNLGEALYYQETGAPDDGFLFQYVSGIAGVPWVSLGLIQGPKGDIGNTGPTGPTGAQGDDIFVGPDDPSVVKPTTELWYDTDDDRILGPTDLPLGGLPGQFLIKKTDLDGDVEWSGVNGRTAYIGDNAGYFFTGNGGIFKQSGGGWHLRRHNNNANIQIQNNDGTAGSEIIIANGNVPMAGTLKWPNAEGDKIYLYQGATAGTNSYGLGISASAMALFVPDNANFRFRDGGGHDGGSEYMVLGNNSCVINGTTDINGGLTANSVDVANSHIQITGSNGTNSGHFYVSCATNDGGYYFNVLEARRQDFTNVFHLKGWQSSGASPNCNAKMYTNLGTEGVQEITSWQDYGDGQASLEVHGPCASTHFEDRNLRSAVPGTSAPVDSDLVGRLIDAVQPVTFARHFRSPEASDSNPEGFVAPQHDPIPTIGLDVDGIDNDYAARLRGPKPGGYSVGGMVTVAVSEIKSLRARVAELEAQNAGFEARLAALEARV